MTSHATEREVLGCAAGRHRRRGPLGGVLPVAAHWRKIWSTNPLERLHHELKRCTDVVGVFPTTPRSNGSSPP